MNNFDVSIKPNYHLSSETHFDKKLGTNVTKLNMSVIDEHGKTQNIFTKREYTDKDGFQVIKRKQIGTKNVSTIKKKENGTSSEIRKYIQRVLDNGDVLIINSKELYEHGERIKQTGNALFPKLTTFDINYLTNQLDKLDNFTQKVLKDLTIWVKMSRL